MNGDNSQKESCVPVDENKNQIAISATVERISEERIEKDGSVTKKTAECLNFTGDAALLVAQEQAKAIERESIATADGIKNGLTVIGIGLGIGAACGVYSAIKKESDISTTSTSGETITTDAKVPGNDNIPGNGSGAA